MSVFGDYAEKYRYCSAASELYLMILR